MSDNIAVLEGYIKEVCLTNNFGDSLFLLIREGEDLDSRFKAWDTDNQEFIIVNGWLFCSGEA